MSDSVRVTNFPSDGTPHRVAYDLMKDIAFSEQGSGAPKQSREYFLTLYRQCYKVVYRERSFAEVTAREYLDMRDEAVTLEELIEALRTGGFDFEAQGWNETMRLKNLSISLGKNSAMFHRLPNGLMGLVKWYPNLKAKKIAKSPEDNNETDPDQETEETEGE